MHVRRPVHRGTRRSLRGGWCCEETGLTRRGASAMDAKAKRKVIAEMLAKLQADLDMAVEQMPDDWDETELQWFLVRRAELFYIHRASDRLRHIAYNNALRIWGL